MRTQLFSRMNILLVDAMCMPPPAVCTTYFQHYNALVFAFVLVFAFASALFASRLLLHLRLCSSLRSFAFRVCVCDIGL